MFVLLKTSLVIYHLGSGYSTMANCESSIHMEHLLYLVLFKNLSNRKFTPIMWKSEKSGFVFPLHLFFESYI